MLLPHGSYIFFIMLLYFMPEEFEMLTTIQRKLCCWKQECRKADPV